VSTDATVNVLNLAQVLQDAAARNLTLELHTYHGANRKLQVAKTRVLGLNDQHLIIAYPQSSGIGPTWDQDQPVEAFLQVNATFFTFKTQVRRVTCQVKLNEKKRIKGMLLARPTHWREGQRRETYRMSLASVEPIEVRLHNMLTLEPATCSLNTHRIIGRLVNASANSLGILLESTRLSDFRIGRSFATSFVLPNTEHELLLMAELRNVRRVRNDEALILGFLLILWPNALDFHKNQQPLARFLNNLQRQQIMKQS